MSISGQFRSFATAAMPVDSKAASAFTPVMGLSPTATCAPAFVKASIAAATTWGWVVTPVAGWTFLPALGLRRTRLPFATDRSMLASAEIVLAYGSSPDAQKTAGLAELVLKGVCGISLIHSQYKLLKCSYFIMWC